MSRTTAITPAQFTTFGELLKYLRHRTGLTQRELSIAVNYSEGQISRLEKNERTPDSAVIAARFVPALDLEREPEWTGRLLELAGASRVQLEAGEKARPPAETPNNLPIQRTGFVGREREIADLKRLLTSNGTAAQEVRLLTLTGVGGSGKTRLALCAASELLSEFPGGVWFVNLAPIADPLLVIQTVLQTLGLNLPGNQAPLDRLKEFLSGKVTLLLLDNYEQLADAAAWITGLLSEVQDLKLLVTSRVALHLTGEQEFLVPPLPIPDLETLTLEEVSENESVALFVQRARAVRMDFRLTPENMTAVAEICVRLDGLPLAIELAAARLKVLGPTELLSRLGSRLKLLTGGSRDLPARQQTLRNTIDWSYQLLKPEEKRLFARLGVFVGGWVLDAAERVCDSGGDLSGGLVDCLAALLDHNLIQQTLTSDGAARFGMLETLREFALGRLEVRGELEIQRQQHAEYYLALIEAALPKNFGELPTREAITQMRKEQANLRAALAWSQVSSGNAQMGLRLAESVLYLFLMRDERRAWLERALAHGDAEGGYAPATRARVIKYLGEIQALLGDFAGGEARMLEAVGSFQQLGDRNWTAASMERWGWVARERGDPSTARARLEPAMELARELNNHKLIFSISNTLADTMTMQGDTVAARLLLVGILPLERESRDTVSLPWTLNHLGHVAQVEGEYDQATALYVESLSLFREHNVLTGIIETLYSLGETALAQGDAALAKLHLAESLTLTQKSYLPSCIAWCLAGMAGVAVLNVELERAAELWGAAERLRQRLGARAGLGTHAVHDRLKALARHSLGDETFEAAWARGANADVNRVIEDLLRGAQA